MGALTFTKLFFNKYTAILAAIISVYFIFAVMSSNIENLEKSLIIEAENNSKLKSELININKVKKDHEIEMMKQVEEVLKLQIENNNLKIDLQKNTEKRNKKDIDNIIKKKQNLTEKTLNRFIKILTLFLSSCISTSEPIKIQTEEVKVKVVMLNNVKRLNLEVYEVDVVVHNNKGLICLDDTNFKIVGNNSDKKDLYITELEYQIKYYTDIIKRHNEK